MYSISSGSNKIVKWIGKCGHKWSANVKNRVKGAGCPYCSGNKVLIGFNDLASKAAELSKEWSDKNFPLKPEDVTCKCNKKVW